MVNCRLVPKTSVAPFQAGLALAVAGMCAALTGGCGEGPSAPSTTPGAVAVTSVQPHTAPSGAEVTLYGAGFQQGLTVTFGGVMGTVIEVLASQVRVTTPDHLPGRVDIVVTNPSSRTSTLTNGFTFIPFEITSIVPNLGFPRLRFHVFGTGFMSGARVTVGGVEATRVWLDTNTMVGEAPDNSLGPADVVVTNPGGRSVTLTGGFTYYSSPVIGVTPTIVQGGGTLTVNWEVSLTSGFDWIGLYRVGASNHSYLSWQYISGYSGMTTFTAPAESGQYEFRYLPLDGYDDYARTGIVTVTASSVPNNRAASIPLSRTDKPASQTLRQWLRR